MRIEDLHQATAQASQDMDEREMGLGILARNLAVTLEIHSSRRLNGWGWATLGTLPFPIFAICNLIAAYPLADQSPLSVLTKRSLRTSVDLEDGPLDVRLSSSRGNPHKPGYLYLDVEGMSRLQIENFNSGDRAANMYTYNPRNGFWNDQGKWIDGRPASSEEIKVSNGLVRIVETSLSGVSSFGSLISQRNH